ncbi:hypothetical protein GUJ93_ZPchr0010g9866 [Zizania palustris]|uniref:Uncharacterized protein n=1 Tax=Zizania palustris TaxID=103762 RepID=A0A8J5W9H5_ZIZPA|nr:hypothetical protein GUJ93_ZPchr0010g9866 [Zizania palustris]
MSPPTFAGLLPSLLRLQSYIPLEGHAGGREGLTGAHQSRRGSPPFPGRSAVAEAVELGMGHVEWCVLDWNKNTMRRVARR